MLRRRLKRCVPARRRLLVQKGVFMLKIAVAGLGAISGVHLGAIAQIPQARLQAVCDIDSAKKEKAPGVPFYTDMETMLREVKPDILHICLPHMLHVPAAKLAAKYGVHVFMEKPPALHVRQLHELDGLEQSAGIKIGVCLQNRYNNTTKELQRRLASGETGKIQGCKAILTWNRPKEYYTKDPWRGLWEQAGGGMMLSQAIHTLDLMTLFCGPARAVQGFTANLVHPDIQVEDTAVAQIEFEGNVRGLFYGSVGYSSDAAVELELDCEKAVYRISDGRLWQTSPAGQILLAQDVLEHGGKSYYGNGHLEAIQRFYRSVEQHERDYITLEDAAACMALIDGVNQSAAEGKKVRAVT